MVGAFAVSKPGRPHGDRPRQGYAGAAVASREGGSRNAGGAIHRIDFRLAFWLRRDTTGALSRAADGAPNQLLVDASSQPTSEGRVPGRSFGGCRPTQGRSNFQGSSNFPGIPWTVWSPVWRRSVFQPQNEISGRRLTSQRSQELRALRAVAVTVQAHLHVRLRNGTTASRDKWVVQDTREIGLHGVGDPLPLLRMGRPVLIGNRIE